MGSPQGTSPIRGGDPCFPNIYDSQHIIYYRLGYHYLISSSSSYLFMSLKVGIYPCVCSDDRKVSQLVLLTSIPKLLIFVARTSMHVLVLVGVLYL